MFLSRLDSNAFLQSSAIYLRTMSWHEIANYKNCVCYSVVSKLSRAMTLVSSSRAVGTFRLFVEGDVGIDIPSPLVLA